MKANNNEMEQEKSEEQKIADLDTMNMFGMELYRLAERQVSLKSEIEERWIDDLRHYNGRYDRDTQAKLDETNKTGRKTSTIFVNLTRAKTNLAESKLSDMIFPTDDRNWGLEPTPVPDLVSPEAMDKPVQLVNGAAAVNPETGEPYTYKDLQTASIAEAKDKAELMQREVDDQLKESKYDALGRNTIHWATVLGTGIIKGPMVERRNRRSWTEVATSDGKTLHKMTFTADIRPFVGEVDPWNFFPDMTAICWEDAEFCFERHLLTPKKVRNLAKRPGFMLDQLRVVLSQPPRATGNRLAYLNEIRQINGITNITEDNRYEIWEYHGPIRKEYLSACGYGDRGEEDDPLKEVFGVVWFCGQTVLKVGLHHLDDESLPYSVFNWEKDETSIFGFGVPYRMRGPQRVINGSWRMLLDNAGLSTGPQVVVNRKVVEPADGVWEITPRKLWFVNKEGVKAEDAFDTFDIQSNQQQLMAIFEMAKQLSSDETNLPDMGQSFQEMSQPAVMKTLGGTALWMSSQNITMRRAVKNWDDDITSTLIPRMYYWNMQFNPKNEIKGDYDTIARGSSVLMVREMQARNLLEYLNVVYSNPNFVSKVNEEGLLRQITKSMQIPEKEVLKSQDQTKADEAQQQQAPPDPELIKAQTQLQIAQLGREEKLIEANAMLQARAMEREIRLTELAIEQQMTLQEMDRKYGLETMKSDRDLEKFYQEFGLKRTESETANYGLE